MYTHFYSLTEKPFSITPDPAYLFLSPRHEEALAHLIYGVTDSGGFIQLTGEVGTGKTTIIRSLLEQLPGNVDIALILNPRLNVNEFLHLICDELRLPLDKNASNKECFDVLNEFLLEAHAEGRRVVLLIDEAQNLDVDVLEQIRLLTNLETHKHKLLQIILGGQPELQTLLERKDLRQLAQRITARYHLMPLSQAESSAYIEHRLLINNKAKQKIYQAAGGIPRIMNVVADRALLGAFSQEKKQVDVGIVKHAIKEVVDPSYAGAAKNNPSSIWKPILLSVLLGVSGLAVFKSGVLSDGFTLGDKSLSTKQVINENKQIPKPTVETLVKNNIPVLSVDEQTQVKAVPAKEQTVKKDLPTILAKNYAHTSVEQAFNKLLSIWSQAELSEYKNACEQVIERGLYCYYQQGNISDLSVMDRPAILELVDKKSVIHQVVLSSLDGETVSLSLHNQIINISVAELNSLWNGNYLIFWKPEAAYINDALAFGSEGAAVDWLKRRLNALGVEPRSNQNAVYFNRTTKEQVINFQLKHKLEADGVVGRKTFISINNAIGLADRPKLLVK